MLELESKEQNCGSLKIFKKTLAKFAPSLAVVANDELDKVEEIKFLLKTRGFNNKAVFIC
jgi:hypothetical protein